VDREKAARAVEIGAQNEPTWGLGGIIKDVAMAPVMERTRVDVWMAAEGSGGRRTGRTVLVVRNAMPDHAICTIRLGFVPDVSRG
jgi:hypothetical protein